MKAPKSGKKSYTVDGYDHTTNTIHQFNGCYWHGCRRCYPDFEERRNKTVELSKLFTSKGMNVEEMRECDWERI